MARIVSKKIGNQFYVWDSTLNIALGVCPTKESADELVTKYDDQQNQEFEPRAISPSRRWIHGKASNDLELQDLLDQGFEPYSASDRFIYLKKQIQGGII